MADRLKPISRPRPASTRGRSGFTLVEMVVVIIIVAILAAIVGRRFFEFTSSARDRSLRHSLSVLRSAIESHRLRNEGSYPGDAGTEADLKADLRPYLRRFPENPVTQSDAVSAQSTGQPIVAASGTAGWIYDSVSGEIRANSDELSEDGRPYVEL